MKSWFWDMKVVGMLSMMFMPKEIIEAFGVSKVPNFLMNLSLLCSCLGLMSTKSPKNGIVDWKTVKCHNDVNVGRNLALR